MIPGWCSTGLLSVSLIAIGWHRHRPLSTTGNSCCIAAKMQIINEILTTDPVKPRVALLAADPPDNAKPAAI